MDVGLAVVSSRCCRYSLTIIIFYGDNSFEQKASLCLYSPSSAYPGRGAVEAVTLTG